MFSWHPDNIKTSFKYMFFKSLPGEGPRTPRRHPPPSMAPPLLKSGTRLCRFYILLLFNYVQICKPIKYILRYIYRITTLTIGKESSYDKCYKFTIWVIITSHFELRLKLLMYKIWTKSVGRCDLYYNGVNIV